MTGRSDLEDYIYSSWQRPLGLRTIPNKSSSRYNQAVEFHKSSNRGFQWHIAVKESDMGFSLFAPAIRFVSRKERLANVFFVTIVQFLPKVKRGV